MRAHRRCLKNGVPACARWNASHAAAVPSAGAAASGGLGASGEATVAMPAPRAASTLRRCSCRRARGVSACYGCRRRLQGAALASCVPRSQSRGRNMRRGEASSPSQLRVRALHERTARAHAHTSTRAASSVQGGAHGGADVAELLASCHCTCHKRARSLGCCAAAACPRRARGPACMRASPHDAPGHGAAGDAGARPHEPRAAHALADALAAAAA